MSYVGIGNSSRFLSLQRSDHLPGALWKDCERKSGRAGEVMSPLTPGGEARAPALRPNSAKKPIHTSVKKKWF